MTLKRVATLFVIKLFLACNSFQGFVLNLKDEQILLFLIEMHSQFGEDVFPCIKISLLRFFEKSDGKSFASKVNELSFRFRFQFSSTAVLKRSKNFSPSAVHRPP